MGQTQNRGKPGVFYPPPEQRMLLRKRAGSVSSLARLTSTSPMKKSEKKGTLRRSRSNQELIEIEDRQRALYEQVQRSRCDGRMGGLLAGKDLSSPVTRVGVCRCTCGDRRGETTANAALGSGRVCGPTFARRWLGLK